MANTQRAGATLGQIDVSDLQARVADLERVNADLREQLRTFMEANATHAGISTPETNDEAGPVPAGVRHAAAAHKSLKPQKPTAYDPSQKDSNVRTWLFSVNNFFAAADVPADAEEAKINFAVTLLQGPALEWWRQMTLLSGREHDSGADGDRVRRALFTPAVGAETRARMAALQQKPDTWRRFEEAIVARFDLVNAGVVARNKLKRLRQLTSVQDYTRRFLALCAEIDDLSEAEQKDRYFDGLKPEVQQVLILQGVEDFSTMIATAERIDALQFQQRSRTRPMGPRRVAEVSGVEEISAVESAKQIICYNCRKPGHIARDCKEAKRAGGRPTNGKQGNESRQQ